MTSGHSIAFMGRPMTFKPKSVGHMFVVIRTRTASGVKEDAFGFYPNRKEDEYWVFDIPSKVVRTDLSGVGAVTKSFEVSISDEQRAAVYQAIQAMAGVNYDLVVRNCISFSISVAAAAGLKTPEKTAFASPDQYVVGLYAANQNDSRIVGPPPGVGL